MHPHTVFMFLFAAGALCLLGVVAALGQAHVHNGVTIEDKVGLFYERWKRPEFRGVGGERTASCCNRNDCYRPKIRRVEGRLEVWHPPTGRWVHMPDYLIERNQPDAEESPDGQNHACINNSGVPLCYVDAPGT